ncbi:MAG: hypothetical protein ACI4AH_00180 [Muribaculaceae bacterium]
MIRRIVSTTIAIMGLLLSVATSVASYSQENINFEASVTLNVSDGALAPYYAASNRYGTLTQGKSTLASAAVWQKMDTTRRFSFGFGAEAWAGWTSDVDYSRYDVGNATWNANAQHPARAWVQQLYAEVKYRGVYAVLGQKEHRNALTNAALSSGDMTLSGNARPMPGLRMGFIDFQDIPFTNGWVQIEGEVGYYKDMQNSWLEDHYNYYNNYITTDTWFNYKRCYFRTKPSERLSVTVGMQASCQFAGERKMYRNGDVYYTDKNKTSFKTFVKALFPASGSGGSSNGDKAYYEGNHLGSWDLAVRYRLAGDKQLRAYYQSPFEDGSGIGKLNGWDGLYGLEYRTDSRALITGAVIEYLDLMNQSGPMHWAPGDSPDSPLRDEATGADNYYNNYFFNGYSELGMSIGSPMLKSTIYNRDGYLAFTDNRLRGVHAAVTGYLMPDLSYRVMASYRKSSGTVFVPAVVKREATSVMVEGTYDAHKHLPGLSVSAQVAIDRGKLYGDNLGAVVAVRYCGRIGK